MENLHPSKLDTLTKSVMRPSEFQPTGYLCISNYGGIELMLSDDGESAIYSIYGKISERWQKIKYTPTGRAYITIKNRRYFLSEFLKHNT